MANLLHGIGVDESEIKFTFKRSSGPGGQNVNKVATAAELTFNLNQSSLPDTIKSRLKDAAGSRISKEGILKIHASRFRTQSQNKKDALSRFISLLEEAKIEPKRRVKTKPTYSSVEKRLRLKKIRSNIKKQRSTPPEED